MNRYGKRTNQTYGVLQKNAVMNDEEEIVESLQRNGFALLDAGYTSEELNEVKIKFDVLRSRYIEKFGEKYLNDINELYTIRAPLTHEDGDTFLNLALNSKLQSIVSRMIKGKFILNQQNGVVFPAKIDYDQGHWHRDLPYQHFTSSSPLAINALFCLDDLTYEAGAMWVVPGSHMSIECPSDEYIKKYGIQIESKKGQFVLLNCMVYHCGGFNDTNADVKAVNHVFTIPYFKQQINIPKSLDANKITHSNSEVLGVFFEEPINVKTYLDSRKRR